MNFKQFLLNEEPAPAGAPPGGAGGLASPGALPPGGAGGMPPMGGGMGGMDMMGGMGGGMGGPGGMPGGAPTPPQKPVKIQSYDVWKVLEKLLNLNQQVND